MQTYRGNRNERVTIEWRKNWKNRLLDALKMWLFRYFAVLVIHSGPEEKDLDSDERKLILTLYRARDIAIYSSIF